MHTTFHDYEVRVKFDAGKAPWVIWETGIMRSSAEVLAKWVIGFKSPTYGQVIESRVRQIGTDRLIAHHTAPLTHTEG